MAKANLYDVYDISGRLVLANAQRKDIANMLEMSVRTLDDRLKFTANTVIRGYTIQCTVKRNYEGPVNNEVRKIMATGIWDEVCRPFRKLRRLQNADDTGRNMQVVKGSQGPEQADQDTCRS